MTTETTPNPAVAVGTATAVTVSVVICAYTDERWDDVLAAVESVRTQRPAPAEIVLVIDHNPDLHARMAAHLAGVPGLRVVENAHGQGLSGGKNTGVEVTSGDVVAYLDDDAVAEPGWIAAMVAAYTDDDVLGVGGLTLPAWATGRPAWWPGEFDWVVGCTFVGREPGVVRNLLGGNASFRRSVFTSVGGFPEHIGRSAVFDRPLGCEETEFCIRVGQAVPRGRFLFDRGAVIHHRVPRVRERFAYFRSRCYAEGLSKALVADSVGASDGLSTERSYAAVVLRRGVVRGLGEALRGDLDGARRAGAIVTGLAATTLGYVVGAAKLRRAGGGRRS